VGRPEPADVLAAAGGDVAAFERLVHAVQGPIWRYLVHLLGDRGLAEDVAQEVLLRVHTKLRTLRDPDRFLPWVLVMCRNAAYDAARATRRRQVPFLEDVDLTKVKNPADPHVSLEIADALGRLDRDLREALVIVGILGLSYGEAAKVLRVPEGTVKSRVFRARRLLIDALGNGVDDAR